MRGTRMESYWNWYWIW